MISEFDPAKNPRHFVIRKTKHTWEVFGPADTSEGACFRRELVCTCRSEFWAEKISELLNLTAGIRPERPPSYTTDDMQAVARQWLKARNIIRDFLQELDPYLPTETLEHNAAAIIARLAQAEPPLLICEPDEMKE